MDKIILYHIVQRGRPQPPSHHREELIRKENRDKKRHQPKNRANQAPPVTHVDTDAQYYNDGKIKVIQVHHPLQFFNLCKYKQLKTFNREKREKREKGILATW